MIVESRGGGPGLGTSTRAAAESPREDLLKKLAEPDFIQTYNRPRLQKHLAASFPIETLGGFVHWYTNGDIDRPDKERLKEPGKVDGCYPKWPNLAKATRQDYLEAYEYLRPEFWLDDVVSGRITTIAELCTREKCSVRQVNMTISLAFLAPNLVKAAIEGRLPRGIGVERLRDPPTEWSRQFEALGLNPE